MNLTSATSQLVCYKKRQRLPKVSFDYVLDVHADLTNNAILAFFLVVFEGDAKHNHTVSTFNDHCRAQKCYTSKVFYLQEAFKNISCYENVLVLVE